MHSVVSLTFVASSFLVSSLVSAELRSPFSCEKSSDCVIMCPNDFTFYEPPICYGGNCLCHLENWFGYRCYDNDICAAEYNETLLIDKECFCFGGEPIVESYRQCQSICPENKFGKYDVLLLSQCMCVGPKAFCEYGDSPGLCELGCYLRGKTGTCNEDTCECDP